MGDAVRDGDVHAADLDDTIDAGGSRPDPTPPPVAMPSAIIAATRDYQELLAVDRHHYAITREIARGGIGRVFEARDLRLGRQVAIKELLPKNRDAARRFEREARITSRLQHPAIIHVYEAGTWPGGEPFYAMPLVAGRSFDKVVAEHKTLDDRLGLLPNVIAVADALAYAHNSNVIHRDLKPANVLIGEYGETVVIDWGLAKDLGVQSDPKESIQMRLRATAEETVSGSVVGTPAYMPPEQARGDAVDQRADVYALGALLYKVLCGAAPYEGTAKQVLDDVKTRPPISLREREPGAPSDLVAIVDKAMAREPRDRYVTASELAQDLKRFETGQLVGVHRYTLGELLRRWLGRHRMALSIASVALVTLIAFGAFSVKQIIDEKRDANAARDVAKAGRASLLEEQGRVELLAGHAGAALAYLGGASADGKIDGARGFLIADAMRPFDAQLDYIAVGNAEAVVAVSRDGTYIAIGGRDRITLRGSQRSTTMVAPGVTRAIAFDAGATKLVAAGQDGVARVWSIDGTLLAELRGHIGAVLDATFTLDGRQVVTTGADASVRIWDLATRRDESVACHTGPVVSARISPDGKYVLTASADYTACIILLELDKPISPRPVRRLKGHTGPVNAAVWSADGALVVTASSDGTARVWETSFGKPIADSLRHEPGSTVYVALITDDGLVITAGSDLTIRLWELPAIVPAADMPIVPVKLRRKLVGHYGRIVSAGLSADQTQLATGGFDGLAKIWSLESGQELASFEHGDIVNAVSFVPGEAWLVAASRDGGARLWNTEPSETRTSLDSTVTAVAIAGDGTIAAARADSVVTLLRGSQRVDLDGHLGSVLALAFSPDGKRLITAGTGAVAIVWDPASGKQVGLLRPARDPVAPVRAVAYAPTGDHVAMLRGGVVEIWSTTTATQFRTLAKPGGVIDAIAINPQTGALAAVGQDGTFLIWDASGTALYDGTDSRAPYGAVAYATAGNALVTAGAGIAHVWTLDRDRIKRLDVTLEQGGMGIVNAVLITPDGARVITAGDNGRAMIWDRRNGKLLGVRDRHDKPITALALGVDTLWIGSADETLTSWNVRVEHRSFAALQAFMIGKHVPVQLAHDVVTRKSTETIKGRAP